MHYFDTILSHYGYNSFLKQQAFANLLFLSGAFSFDTSNDFYQVLEFSSEKAKVLKEACLLFNSPSFFSAEKFLEYFLQESCFTLHDAHDWLVRVTQNLFFARNGERWETKPPSWTKGKEEAILSYLSILEYEKEILPTHTSYDAVCIFGATKKDIINYCNFLKYLFEEKHIQESTVYLLTGERYASDIDGTEEELSAIATACEVKRESLTETHLMQHFYKEAMNNHPSMHYWKCVTIDTPRGKKTRPTTKDTLELFKEKTKNTVKSALFISHAPHILPQKEDVDEVLKEAIPLRDITGASYRFMGHSNEELNLYVSHILEALGSQLFGGYKRVFHALEKEQSLNHSNAYIKDRMHALAFTSN